MNETFKRLISGIVYVVLLISATYHSVNSFIVLFGVFLLIAIYEFCELVTLNKVTPLLIGGTVFYLGTQFKSNKTIDLIALVVVLSVSIKALLLLFDSEKDKVNTFSKYVYTIGYIIIPFLIITKIPFGVKGFNPKIIISIFILIWTNDTFAYLVGKTFGKNKLFEIISPKKTIEGFFGGLIFCIIASIIISKFYIGATATYIWVIIALIVGIFGTLGDLVESKFKRIAGVKDSGKIMPGHGGILDRLDSVIFVAPFVFLFYQILYYVS